MVPWLPHLPDGRETPFYVDSWPDGALCIVFVLFFFFFIRVTFLALKSEFFFDELISFRLQRATSRVPSNAVHRRCTAFRVVHGRRLDALLLLTRRRRRRLVQSTVRRPSRHTTPRRDPACFDGRQQLFRFHARWNPVRVSSKPCSWPAKTERKPVSPACWRVIAARALLLGYESRVWNVVVSFDSIVWFRRGPVRVAFQRFPDRFWSSVWLFFALGQKLTSW